MDEGIYKPNKYTDIAAGNCKGLASALSIEPISVAVDATNWSYYSSGILSSCGRNLNHGVLLVGLTSEYWKIQNSWGASWGE